MSNFLGIRTWGRKMHTFGTNMYIKTPVDFCEWLTIRAAATWKTPTRSYPKTLLTHGQTFAAAGLTLLRKIATRFTSLKSNPAHLLKTERNPQKPVYPAVLTDVIIPGTRDVANAMGIILLTPYI